MSHTAKLSVTPPKPLPAQIGKKFTTFHTISSIYLDANCNGGGTSLVLTPTDNFLPPRNYRMHYSFFFLLQRSRSLSLFRSLSLSVFPTVSFTSTYSLTLLLTLHTNSPTYWAPKLMTGLLVISLPFVFSPFSLSLQKQHLFVKVSST